jgi:hypothetical protein
MPQVRRRPLSAAVRCGVGCLGGREESV